MVNLLELQKKMVERMICSISRANPNVDDGINTTKGNPSTSGHFIRSFEDVEVDANNSKIDRSDIQVSRLLAMKRMNVNLKI